jgi:hypothetical protein
LGAPTPDAQTVARQVALANAQSIDGLCVGGASVPMPTAGTPLNLPQRVNAIVVTAQCDAPYTFGRILGLITPRHITASAAAAIGNRDPVTGDMTDFTDDPSNPADTGFSPDCQANADHCRVARLIE